METGTNPDDRSNDLTAMVTHTLELSNNCAQTAFAMLQQAFNLDGAEILKALTPFPGLALRGETCGAVTGCLMALGLVYGRDDLGDSSGFLRSLPPARRFCRRFVEQNGSTTCAQILEQKLGRAFNLADQAEALEYAAAGGAAACAQVVASAVQIASGLMSK